MVLKITRATTLEEALSVSPRVAEVLLKHGLHCIGCSVAYWETLEQGALAHGMGAEDIDRMLEELNALEGPVSGGGSGGAEGAVKTLDLRALPPPERHRRIFEMWDSLSPGETLRIINDHDPKPLRYQFEAEFKGEFAWDYELGGPDDWIVRIRRV